MMDPRSNDHACTQRAIHASHKSVKKSDARETIRRENFVCFCYKFVSVGSHIRDSVYLTI